VRGEWGGVVVEEEGGGEVAEQHHQRFAGGVLVGVEDEDHSLFLQLPPLLADGQARIPLYSLF
jgi:hypothetical protein